MKIATNKLLPLAALAMLVLTSCGKAPVAEPTPEPGEVSLSLIVEKTTVNEGAEIPFKITTPNAPQSNLTIQLTVSDKKVLSVPPILVIAKGEKEVSSEAIAVSRGKGTITISSEGIATEISSIQVTVTEK